MLIRTVKHSDGEINFQSSIPLRMVLGLKMADRLREGLLSGVFDRKVVDFT